VHFQKSISIYRCTFGHEGGYTQIFRNNGIQFLFGKIGKKEFNLVWNTSQVDNDCFSAELFEGINTSAYETEMFSGVEKHRIIITNILKR
jgi:hypothetical protein